MSRRPKKRGRDGEDLSRSNSPAENDSSPTRTVSWVERVLPPLLIVVLAAVVYANSFQGEFIHDDRVAILENPTIRHLSPLSPVLFPPPDLIAPGVTIEGRPLLNLSFALNHAAGGYDVWGYHAVNLAIHVAAGLLLYGVVRRTLLLPKWFVPGLCAVTGQRVDEVNRAGTARSDRARACADHPASWLAMLVALLWVLHPLQTESVTYVVQRAESLVGLFYLLTMYLTIRGFGSSRLHSRWWRAGAVLACMLGMATKEVMVTAPVMLLLYDWLFVAGTWRAVWERRARFYTCLMALGWGTLAAVMIKTAGSNLDNVKALVLQLSGSEGARWSGHDLHWLDYARMQVWAVARYLRLSFWPSPLVFVYGRDVADTFWSVAPSMAVVALVVAGTGWALWRRSWAGYAGAWFLVILAPTSSVVPLSGQVVAEHRAYLPLAGIAAWVVIGGYKWMRRLPGQSRWRIPLAFASAGTALVIFGWLTMARNEQYRTSFSIWQDSIRKWPTNPAPWSNLGVAYFHEKRYEEAMVNFRKALELAPRFSQAHNHLGNCLMVTGRIEEAALHYRTAATLAPKYVEALGNLGNALNKLGKPAEAIEKYRTALELAPDQADIHHGFGAVLLGQNRMDEAVAEFQKAIALQPDHSGSLSNLGAIWLLKNDPAKAIPLCEKALEGDPDLTDAHFNLGKAYAQTGRPGQAVTHYEAYIQVRGEDTEARVNLGLALAETGKPAEAVRQWEEALRQDPNYLPALQSMSWILATHADSAVRDGAKAVELGERARNLSGGMDPKVLEALAAAHAETGRFEAANEIGREALRLAVAQKDEALAAALTRELESYQARTAFREASKSAGDAAK